MKGPFQSFPYRAVCWLLFFLLMFPFGAGPFAALVFFTIPIYHWVARALTARAQNASAAVDTDVVAATTAEPVVKEGDE